MCYLNTMTRDEAIATINTQLAHADDETVEAEYVRSLSEAKPLRALSERERGLLEQSRRDFEAGRTYTIEEFMARTDDLLARHRKAKAAQADDEAFKAVADGAVP